MSWHGGSMGTFEGHDGCKAVAARQRPRARGMKFTPRSTRSRGDKVILRFTNSGTNVGAFMGNAATNKRAEWLGIGIYAIRDDRIVEAWFGEDVLGMLVQLDAIDLTA
jgi:predicted ester cyclase